MPKKPAPRKQKIPYKIPDEAPYRTPYRVPYWERLLSFSRLLDEKSTQLNTTLTSLHKLFKDLSGPSSQKIASSGTALPQKTSSQQGSPQQGSPQNPPQNPPLTGDSFYDLIHSPAIQSILKEAIKYRQKPPR